MKKLKDKYNVEHIEAGYTPDGYDIKETIQLEDTQNRNHYVEIGKGGSAVYYVGVNEASSDKEAYQDMGIDTDSKEFKNFEAGLKDDKNYNSKYINDFLEKAPELTVEKRQEIDKQRDIDLQKEKAEAAVAAAEYEAKGGFLAEMNESEVKNDKPFGQEYHEQIKGRISDKEFEKVVDDAVENALHRPSTFTDTKKDADKEVEREIVNDLNEIIKERGLGENVVSKEVHEKRQKLSESGETEVAKPGRTYTGKMVEVGEDVTIQKTKSGKFVIHETENLPGIKEQDSNISAKIIYDAGGKGDIVAKSNDLAIGKEKEIEQKKSHEKAMER